MAFRNLILSLTSYPIHPLLFATYPILALLAANVTEVEVLVSIRALVISLIRNQLNLILDQNDLWFLAKSSLGGILSRTMVLLLRALVSIHEKCTCYWHVSRETQIFDHHLWRYAYCRIVVDLQAINKRHSFDKAHESHRARTGCISRF